MSDTPKFTIKLPSAEKIRESRENRDGKWMDALGCCRVCDGELPDGHTPNCDLLKMEQKIAALERQIERMKPVVEAAIAWRKRVAFKLCVADELVLKDAVRKYQEEAAKVCESAELGFSDRYDCADAPMQSGNLNRLLRLLCLDDLDIRVCAVGGCEIPVGPYQLPEGSSLHQLLLEHVRVSPVITLL